MKAAVWTDERYGVAAVFIPKGNAPADSATIPQCPPAPSRQWAAKGSDVSWQKWALHLADGLPYAGQWSVQDVPDGADARYALRFLREAQQEKGLAQPAEKQPPIT